MLKIIEALSSSEKEEHARVAESPLWAICPAIAGDETDASHITLSVSFRAFRNRLCILRSIDMHELITAGVIDDRSDWDLFQEDEALFFLSLDDDRAARLWGLIQARMPAGLIADCGA